LTLWIEITKQKKHQKKDPPFQRPKSKGWGTPEEKDKFKIFSASLECPTRLAELGHELWIEDSAKIRALG